MSGFSVESIVGGLGKSLDGLDVDVRGKGEKRAGEFGARGNFGRRGRRGAGRV